MKLAVMSEMPESVSFGMRWTERVIMETTEVSRATAITQKATVRSACRGVISVVSSGGDSAVGVARSARGAASPSGSRPMSSGVFRMRREAGTATSIRTTPMPSEVIRKSWFSTPQAISGTSSPPS